MDENPVGQTYARITLGAEKGASHESFTQHRD